MDIVLRFVGFANPKPRWFFLHFLGNMAISAVCLHPIYIFLSDPLREIKQPVRFDGSAVLISVLHSYHLVAFKCSKADWIHHIVFVLIGCTSQVFYGNWFRLYTLTMPRTHASIGDWWGRISAFYHIFICGIPGGLDYLFLACVQKGWMERKTRVCIAVELNSWFRAPGILWKILCTIFVE